MGLFDFFAGNREEREKDKIAIDIDLHSGVLEQCSICGDIVDKQRDDRLPIADAEAHTAFDNHETQLNIFNGNRDDLIARLRSVREPMPYSCICEDS